MTANLSDDDLALVAEHVLGLLPPDEARRLQARLAVEPDLRAAYRAWTERAAGMLADVVDVAPSAAVKTQVMARLFPAPVASLSRPARGRFWLGLLTGTAMAGAALVLVLPTLRALPPTYQASLGVAEGRVQLVAAYDDRSGTLQLTGIAGRPAPGRDFELWLIPVGAPPVSLGVLPATQTARVIIPDALRPALAQGALAVSDEPAGGSPSGLPTGAVLATAFLLPPANAFPVNDVPVNRRPGNARPDAG